MYKYIIHAAFAIACLMNYAMAQEAVEKPPSNLVGAYLNFIETDDVAYGILYARDFGLRNRFFITLETFEFDQLDRTVTPDYVEEWEWWNDGHEIEIGYLRRVSDPARDFSVFIGPSLAIQFNDSRAEMRYSSALGTTVLRGEMDEDPGINVYANIAIEYVFSQGITVFAIGSFGYAFEHDYELQFETGGGEAIQDSTESDTFWNLAIGLGFSF